MFKKVKNQKPNKTKQKICSGHSACHPGSTSFFEVFMENIGIIILCASNLLGAKGKMFFLNCSKSRKKKQNKTKFRNRVADAVLIILVIVPQFFCLKRKSKKTTTNYNNYHLIRTKKSLKISYKKFPFPRVLM